MAQNTVLASAQTAATSSDITVASGTTITFGLFAAAAIPLPVQCVIRQDSPGKDMVAGKLNAVNPTATLTGPGTFRVYRPNITAYGVNVGVFTET